MDGVLNFMITNGMKNHWLLNYAQKENRKIRTTYQS
jgi:hypothetical protein